MRPPGRVGNRLLATLPPADFDLLAPQLERVALDQDMVLSRAGDQIEHVFFPDSGAISLMIDMANGQTVATAAVGREGAVGILSVLGPSPSASTTIIRAAGSASRITSRFHASFNPESRDPARGPDSHQGDADAVFSSALTPAIPCIRSKPAWHAGYSHFCDHTDHHILPLTQEALSQILGVRRTTVTLLMRNLRESRAIQI